MSVLSILAAILLLGILITVHEFGHFIAARLTGIEVMEFAVGFGPKLFSRVGRKGTRFSLRAIPLGGFCAFYGEDDVEGKHSDDPRSYSRQSVWKRMFTVLMGPIMNFVLALVVAAGFYMIHGVAEIETYMMEIDPGSPAYEAGLQAGDVITAVDGVNVTESTDALIAALRQAKELTLSVERDGEYFNTQCTPFWDEAENKLRIGVTISQRYSGEMIRLSLGQSLSQSWDFCVYAGTVIIDSLIAMVTRGEGLDQTAGPVGVVTIVSEQVRKDGLEAFVNYLVLISVNLGVMNLLPIPGLDGSRFLFTVLEAIRRKPVRPDREAMVHLIGMVFLLGLMVFFTFQDVLRLFQ